MEKFILSPKKRTVFIMGAGASKDDNIPIQNEILEKIINGDFAFEHKKEELKDKNIIKEYKRIASQIRKFINKTFGKTAIKNLSLESLFNILETAQEQRENIGKIELRDIRSYYRDLIQGIMYVTRTDADIEKHNVKTFIDKKTPILSPYTEMGVKIYQKYKSDTINFSFINFNYDICLDRVILSMHDKDENRSFDLDYAIDLGNHALNKEHEFWFGKPRSKRVFLLRPHGSVNWLFCRSCGHVFSKLTRQNRIADIKEGTKCYFCELSHLEPYIVYPSYNRIYENKHLLKIWMYIEDLLRNADKWCFIGYSLPEADRYFSYVLTHIYNYRKAIKTTPEVSVVNLNKIVKKQKEMLASLRGCGSKNCSAVKETEDYFKEIISDKDVFNKFDVYFNDVKKYECSFKDFTDKHFEVI